MQSCTQISTTQQNTMLNVNSDSFSIQKFIRHLHPAPRSVQPSDMMKFCVCSCDPTPWHHLKTMKTFILTNTVWEHDLARGEVQRDQTYPLGNLDKADVEIPARKGPRGLLRSGPCACRKLCHESHPSSILKLTRGFVLPPLLFWKLFNLTLKLLFIFAPTYLHTIRVNQWWSNTCYDSFMLLFIHKLKISVNANGR